MTLRGNPRLAALARLPPGATLLLGVAFWFGFLSWLRPLMLPDEGRYAGVAWDMYRSGTMAVPLLDGMPYFHKPPLYYWMAEIAFRCFGVNEWSARLPSMIGAWAIVAGLYAFMRRYGDERVARITAVVLATTPLFFGGAQFANMDMLVAGMLSLAVLAAASAVLEHRAGRPYAARMLFAGAFTALAVLAKGLIGIVLPGMILFFWIAVERDWKSLRVLLWPPALVVFVAIGAPWFVLMQLRYPGFFHYFFVYQHFQRFADTGFNNVQPFWFYPPVLAGLALPWVLWGGALLRKDFWVEESGRSVRALMAVWIVVVIGFFSLPSSKLIGYIVPAVPPLIVLLAEVLDRAARRPSLFSRNALNASLCAATAICLVAVVVTAFSRRGSAKPLVAQYASQINAGDTFVSLRSYPFDLAFYTRASRPMWVVDEWSDPQVPVRDNWRKELYDASLFEPGIGRQVLVFPSQLLGRVCDASPGVFWFWGNPEDGARYPVLADAKPWSRDGKHALWRLQTNDAFKAARCDGTPTDG